MSKNRKRLARDDGQTLLLGLMVIGAVAMLAVGVGSVARALGQHADRLRAADLAALAGARAMLDAQPRLFEPAVIDGSANPRHLEMAQYLALARAAAANVARRNGAPAMRVTFPGAALSLAPTRIVVTVSGRVGVRGRVVGDAARAEAELATTVLPSAGGDLSGEYRGPLATRQGRPMRPDVALAFDRMAAASRAAGINLIVNDGYRSDAEQAVLFARHPDPKWVARPGTSRHRLGTELDLGPPAAYGWLARNASRFGFAQRYSWEPWHYGFVRSVGSRSVGYGPPDGRPAMPSFVPQRWAPTISRAAQRWNVGAALLAAQLYQESGFNPFRTSVVGAQGIAQFMPGTAQAYGLRDPFDGEAAIMAQAHYMHDLLREFGAVPLALAAYNAGAQAVHRFSGIPPYPETQSYVATILALLGGAGQPVAGTGLEVRLLR